MDSEVMVMVMVMVMIILKCCTASWDVCEIVRMCSAKSIHRYVQLVSRIECLSHSSTQRMYPGTVSPSTCAATGTGHQHREHREHREHCELIT